MVLPGMERKAEPIRGGVQIDEGTEAEEEGEKFAEAEVDARAVLPPFEPFTWFHKGSYAGSERGHELISHDSVRRRRREQKHAKPNLICGSKSVGWKLRPTKK